MALNPSQRDTVVRTIAGEAAREGEQGWAGVASVIRNRSVSGKYSSDPAAVAKEKNQFTAWSPRYGNSGVNISRNSSLYQKIAKVVDGVFDGTIPDPTNGALFYYNPKIANPAWAKTQAAINDVKIGNHRFVGGRGGPVPPGFIPNPTNVWQGQVIRAGRATAATQAVRDLQQMLKDQGYYNGPVDGTMRRGGPTQQALADFQRANGLKVDGVAGPRTFAALSGAQGGSAYASLTPPRGYSLTDSMGAQSFAGGEVAGLNLPDLFNPKTNPTLLAGTGATSEPQLGSSGSGNDAQLSSSGGGSDAQPTGGQQGFTYDKQVSSVGSTMQPQSMIAGGMSERAPVSATQDIGGAPYAGRGASLTGPVSSQPASAGVSSAYSGFGSDFSPGTQAPPTTSTPQPSIPTPAGFTTQPATPVSSSTGNFATEREWDPTVAHMATANTAWAAQKGATEQLAPLQQRLDAGAAPTDTLSGPSFGATHYYDPTTGEVRPMSDQLAGGAANDTLGGLQAAPNSWVTDFPNEPVPTAVAPVAPVNGPLGVKPLPPTGPAVPRVAPVPRISPVPGAVPIPSHALPSFLSSIKSISGPGPFDQSTVHSFLASQQWHAPQSSGSYPFFTNSSAGVGGYVTPTGRAFTYSLRANPGQFSTGMTGDEARAAAYSAAHP